MLKRDIIRYLLSVFHGIFLLILTWLWLSSYLTYGDEFWLIKWSSTIKRVFLNLDEDPHQKRFLFINLAYDKAVIPREDGPGTEVITDRAQLTRFFNISGSQAHSAKFIFCDVFLQGSSDWDDSLELSVSKNNNLIFPAHKDLKGNLIKPALNVPFAIADYQSNRGNTFLKFRLFQDNLINTVPVLMYKTLNQKVISDGLFSKYDDDQPILNSVIVDYPIRTYELLDEPEYTLVNLSELLILPEEVIVNEYLKDRIILMGDLQNDTHNTIFGPMAGTLILLNIYLTLEGGHHRLPWTWFIFLIVSYSLLSYRVFFAHKKDITAPGKREKITEKYPFLLSFFGYLFILGLLSVLSYLIFGIHVNILIIAIYFNVCGFIRNLQDNPNWKKEGKAWLMNIKNEYFKFY